MWSYLWKIGMIEAITYVTCRQRMVNLTVVPFLSYLKVCQSPIPGCTWIFASYYRYRYTLFDYVFIKRLLCQALHYWMSLSSFPCISSALRHYGLKCINLNSEQLITYLMSIQDFDPENWKKTKTVWINVFCLRHNW